MQNFYTKIRKEIVEYAESEGKEESLLTGKQIVNILIPNLNISKQRW